MEQICKPLSLCGKIFTPELIAHLNQMVRDDPTISKNAQARILCEHLSWYSPNGRASLSGAKVALHKLHRRGLLIWPPAKPKRKRERKLCRSDRPLPALTKVPSKAGQVKGLHLHPIEDHKDPLHQVWNDLIIDEHPCGAAPLVGGQVRYLVGSDHGWLGAIGFGPPAFVLGARDEWIGWSTAARVSNLNQVVGLSRFLIRTEVRCANLASMVLGLAVKTLPAEWKSRYGIEPVLLETFTDREVFTGRCFAAANWRRIGASTGRGRLGESVPTKSIKDIWVYPLSGQARSQLQKQILPLVVPRSITECAGQEEWTGLEMSGLALGDERLNRRAEAILQSRWKQPQASFYGSFANWSPAKAAYGFIEHATAPISLETLLEPHKEATLSRMAAEDVVLLPQDTTSLNFSGLLKTSGLGSLGDNTARGLWLHSLLAYRPDGVPLGVLNAHCWARPKEAEDPDRGRNAKSIGEKESFRWLEALHVGAEAARRMPWTQLINLTDREGDLYELHDYIEQGPPNLHNVIRAQHDRNLDCHKKLWAFMAEQPPGAIRTTDVPRRRGQKARKATVEVRWSPITIEAPKVGAKKNWPPLSLWAIWVTEAKPDKGVEPLEWMLLTDMPIADAKQAWEKVEWYRCRWGIEEWHRVLKTGCSAEQREFKTAENLKRVLAFDLIVAWRILACVKLGHALPQLPASVIYTQDELEVLWAVLKKNGRPPPDLSLAQANRLVACLGGYAGRALDKEPGAQSVGIGLRRLMDITSGWILRKQRESPNDDE